ncbi:hypothetical protein [Sphingobacterium zeae]|uniref:Uncharacterized protein n=1 Tax=Sphingobacterium zeae TaxID=1776859 RepID=A0ABU0UA74_9SPHI|nr:hypothetical protein [Sphingobacterium zeae]MDQ1151771.1 hypothetical protein [Sphingobacterium zeae]
MKKIQLIPLVGIQIEGIGQVDLGATRAEVQSVLGTPSDALDDQYYYDELELRLDFNNEGQLEFIESINGPKPEKTVISMYDVNPFEVEATELVTILTDKNQGEVDDAEAGYCYTFLNSSVGVWRQVTEEDVQEEIEEIKADGEYEDNADMLLEDLEKSKFFWTIGIGVAGYYAD